MGGGTCTSEGNYKMSEVITKQKILIADDSEMNRELLAAILEEEYDIIQVNDGVQAVDCLQRQAEEISLLLLDIVMPHMDGFEVLSYMNKEHWIDAIPVVIISSENSPIYIKRGYDLGATDFIGKPFDANMVYFMFPIVPYQNSKQVDWCLVRHKENFFADVHGFCNFF